MLDMSSDIFDLALPIEALMWETDLKTDSISTIGMSLGLLWNWFLVQYIFSAVFSIYCS
jgi:hypothetical protein